MIRTKPYRRLAALTLAFMLAMPAVAAQAACLSEAEMRQVIDSGQAMLLSQALARAGITGTLVSVALCTSGGRYVYEVSVRENGSLRTVVIPAS